MNNVSWMIYAAGVADQARAAFTVFGLIATIIFSFYWFAYYVACDEDEQSQFLRPEPKYFVACLLLLLAAIVTPSRDTIYMIAASEMTERAIQSEMGRDVSDLIRQEVRRMRGQGQ